MLRHIPISKKLPVMMVTLCLLTGAVILVLTNKQASDEAYLRSEAQLKELNAAMHKGVAIYFNGLNDNIASLAFTPSLIAAFEELKAGWEDAVNQNGVPSDDFQKIYIDENPYPAGEKEKYESAGNGTIYDEKHAQFHPYLRGFLEAYGLYDLFLFDLDGNLIYTVYKERDYATNMRDGPWKDSGLAEVYRKALKNPGQTVMVDFAPYAPSNNVPAAFMAHTFHNGNDKVLGVLAFQLPIERTDALMKVEAFEGSTEESFIVGADGYLRTNRRLVEENTILSERVDDAILGVMQSQEKGVLEEQFSGHNAILAFERMPTMGAEWFMVTKIREEEILAPIKAMRNQAMLVGLIVILCATVAAIFVARSIANPIARMTGAMRSLAEGDLDADIPGQDRRDEIGHMASAVQVFKENGIENARLREEQAALEKRAEARRAEVMKELADSFDAQVGHTIQTLLASANNMNGAASRMENTAREMGQVSVSVAAAAEETSSNVSTVASATEELAASSREISAQVQNVARKSEEATSSAQETSSQFEELNSLVINIGEVVSSIKDIAEQTNLLALNATIEAARAGENGKGFAVVADEVKKLANETAAKTEEIGTWIANIQGASQKAVTSMKTIMENIADIDQLSVAAATAVDQQNAATGEIGQNISEVATASNEVTNLVDSMRQSSSDTEESANFVMKASEELSSLSQNLDQTVRDFLKSLLTSGQEKTADQSEDNEPPLAKAA